MLSLSAVRRVWYVDVFSLRVVVVVHICSNEVGIVVIKVQGEGGMGMDLMDRN